MSLCFATNNAHKLSEVRQILGNSFEVLSLQEIGCREELPENQDTLEGNSAEKALYVFEHFKVDCFADDTGLEVKTLDGAPGVYSARYAGPQRSAQDNMHLLLQNLSDVPDRTARFRTVVTLIWQGEKFVFEGSVAGSIALQPTGSQGFGYDPVFVPDGYSKSFAEMSVQEKNTLSHRKRAIEKLVDFLQNQHRL